MENKKTTKKERNYAFIDGQNLHINTSNQGWFVDYVKFMNYLKKKYKIEKAFIFLGYIEKYIEFYEFLEKNNYIVIFKEISWTSQGKIKGNCDAEMIFTMCLHFWAFDKALIVSGDGDFYSIAETLNHLGKFERILAPDIHSFSKKFYKLKGDKVASMNDLRQIVGLLHNEKASQNNL